MKSLIITILIVIFAIIIFARIRKLKLDEKTYQDAFDLIFNNQTIKPTYKYGSSYGWPTFTVTYPSESELIKAEEEGITKSFIKKLKVYVRILEVNLILSILN